jgi:hypothetical protein
MRLRSSNIQKLMCAALVLTAATGIIFANLEKSQAEMTDGITIGTQEYYMEMDRLHREYIQLHQPSTNSTETNQNTGNQTQDPNLYNNTNTNEPFIDTDTNTNANTNTSGTSGNTGTSGNSGNGGGLGKCMLQQFACKSEANASCFKRVRTREVNCSDSICNTSNCVSRAIFFGTSQLKEWDVGNLKGPFPRAETMCILRSSSCPQSDPSCFGDTTFEQISCENTRCVGNQFCIRSQVFVDANDNMVSNAKPAAENNGQGNTDDKLPFNLNLPEFSLNEKGEDRNETIKAIDTGRPNGCYTPEGVWTTEREKCARDQSPFLDPAFTGISNTPSLTADPAREIAVRMKIEERFFPAEERALQLRSLLDSITGAIARLEQLKNMPNLPVENVAQIAATLEWMKQIETTYATGEHTIDAIRQQANALREKLTQTQTMVASVLQQAGIVVTKKPDSVLTGLEKILAEVTPAFQLMQEEGVTVPTEAYGLYLAAESSFAETNTACATNADACANLSEVIRLLEEMIAHLKTAINAAGKPDLEMRISEMF